MTQQELELRVIFRLPSILASETTRGRPFEYTHSGRFLIRYCGYDIQLATMKECHESPCQSVTYGQGRNKEHVFCLSWK